jgi:predicted nuclease of restriction endonuclease-like (RecB) superfamily
VRAAQLRAHRVVNTELLSLYWTIGQTIVDRQSAEGWGTRVTDRLADDLRAEFPSMRGFSGRNLRYMAAAARAWPEPIGQQAVAQLPWGHITVLIDRQVRHLDLEQIVEVAGDVVAGEHLGQPG